MKKFIIYNLALIFLSACGGKPTKTEDNSNQTISKESTNLTNDKTDSIKESTNLANDNASAFAEEIDELNQEKIECNKGEVEVYLDDPDDSITNIRKSPGGDVVLKLIKNDQDFAFWMTLSEAKDGWFLIKSPISGIYNDIEIEGGQGWIHGSVISVDTRNYAGQEIRLLDKPKNGNIVGVIKEESYRLKIKDICGTWVKIEYKGIIGWVEDYWLCGTPITTCS